MPTESTLLPPLTPDPDKSAIWFNMPRFIRESGVISVRFTIIAFTLLALALHVRYRTLKAYYPRLKRLSAGESLSAGGLPFAECQWESGGSVLGAPARFKTFLGKCKRLEDNCLRTAQTYCTVASAGVGFL